ncbi:TPA: hypothetical protein HA251_07775 [Candidatus Woesearchaeota archaeon]|nr:hypothetical protein [Candidatus Woesearchaeota archaeon]
MNFRHDHPTVEMLIAERLECNPYGIYDHAGYEVATQFGGAEQYDDIGVLAYTLALGRAMHSAEHPELPALEYALKPYTGSSPDGSAERTRPVSAQDIERITALYNDKTMIAWSERTAAKAMIALQEAKSRLSQDKDWLATCAELLNNRHK